MRAGQCADVYRLAGHSVRYTSWLGQARKKKRGASNNHAVTHRKEKTAPARQQRPPRGVIAREIINGDEMIRSSPWRAPSAKANDKATQVVCKSMLFCFAMQSHFELRVRSTDHAAKDDNGWRLELGRSNIGSQCAAS